MIGALRLLKIETRRSIGFWFFPVMAAAAGWYGADNLTVGGGVTIWSRSSVQIGTMLVVLTPMFGGVAAWAAGRDRRRGIEELLATTPHPPIARELTGWTSTLSWGLFAYLAAAAYVIVLTMRDATWDGPAVSPILVGLLTVIAGVAIGHLAGSIISSKVTAPFLSIILFFTMALPGSMLYGDPVANLSPWAILDLGIYQGHDIVFYGILPNYLWWASVWLLGLTAIALTGIACRHRRTLPVWGVLGAGIVVSGIGANSLLALGAPPNRNELEAEHEMIPYEPVCIERAIPVCVHPAFAEALEPTASRVGRLMEPLVGIPGAPIRAEQLPGYQPPGTGVRSNNTLDIAVPRIDYRVESAAIRLVSRSADNVFRPAANFGKPQLAIAYWLAGRVHEEPFQRWYATAETQSAVLPAAERFANLEPARQRAWLEEHYRDLRAGRLTLEDLP